MVKNQFGGNKHKSQARKNINSSSSRKLRVAQCEGEVYCVVTRMNGNGMFTALGIDSINRLGFIRGKFTGRGRRDNIVEVGKWVLLGDREWSSTSKTEKCKADLLEVYSDIEKDKLQKSEADKPWSVLLTNDNSFTKIKKEEEDIVFSTESELPDIIGEIPKNETIAFDTNEFISEDFGAFNLDDI